MTEQAVEIRYCELCDEPETMADPLRDTRWGLMHADCAASEPAWEGAD